MKNNELNERGSLSIISSMINETSHKGKIITEGRYFLFFGWSGFAAGICQFILLNAGVGSHYIVWLLAMAVALILSTVWGESRNISTPQYFGQLIQGLYQGFMICVILTFLALYWYKVPEAWSIAFSILLNLVAFAAWIVGTVYQFKPFKIGAAVAWALFVLSIFLPFNFVPLLVSAGILVSTIIPGNMISRDYAQKA